MMILYIDPLFGISGDMILAALVDSGMKIEVLKKGFRKLKIGGVKIKKRRVQRCGIKATALDFKYRRKVKFTDFIPIIERSSLSENVVKKAVKILRVIRKTETKIHGRHKELHELDDIDTLLDALGFALAVDHFGIERIYCGSIGFGQGTVDTHHGMMPAFTYFASRVLANFQLYYHKFTGELVTPTGASIIAATAKPYHSGLSFRFEGYGLGAGKKNYRSHPNILRVMLGTRVESFIDQVAVLQTNIDDATPLVFQKMMEEVKKAGGYDVYLAPYYGRNNRVGVEVTVIAPLQHTEKISRLVLKHTPTLGVRTTRVNRYILDRKIKKVKTSLGVVRIKIAEIDGGSRYSIEYRDLKKIADKKGLSILETEKKLKFEINKIYHGFV